VKSYVGLHGPSSPGDQVFACPADTFYFNESSLAYSPQGHHAQRQYDYSSYAFNGLNLLTNFPAARFGVTLPGIGGVKLSAIQKPARTVMIAEAAALMPYSWHEPQKAAAGALPLFNDSKNMLSFADSHAGLVKMFWNRTLAYPDGSPAFAAFYDPPPEYTYQWSGD
jgi:hypothetical protein